uniref:Uncharacterized protein n=1 Tax=Leviviridae sp. TaxID=2027243 RepID=A0A514D6P4_9VIRU|nr:MAG: hypothetical protein H3RhizoL13507e1361_000002 [Leviviridae sp.]
MPSLANITVKKNDGTTDIVWSGVAASAGDKSPALWRSLTVGAAPAFQPAMKMTSRDNGTKSARRVDVEVTYPYTTTGTDGKTYLAEKAIFTGSFVAPQAMPAADYDEAVAQAMNLMASTLVKQSFQAGFSPT